MINPLDIAIANSMNARVRVDIDGTTLVPLGFSLNPGKARRKVKCTRSTSKEKAW